MSRAVNSWIIWKLLPMHPVSLFSFQCFIGQGIMTTRWLNQRLGWAHLDRELGAGWPGEDLLHVFWTLSPTFPLHHPQHLLRLGSLSPAFTVGELLLACWAFAHWRPVVCLVWKKPAEQVFLEIGRNGRELGVMHGWYMAALPQGIDVSMQTCKHLAGLLWLIVPDVQVSRCRSRWRISSRGPPECHVAPRWHYHCPAVVSQGSGRLSRCTARDNCVWCSWCRQGYWLGLLHSCFSVVSPFWKHLA